MNNTPTPRTDAVMPESTNWYFPASEEYKTQRKEMQKLERELTAAREGWHDEITKGLSELRNAESLYTKAQERAEKAEEQRDRLAEALRKAISWGDSASHHILHRQNINWTYLNDAREALAAVKGESNES